MKFIYIYVYIYMFIYIYMCDFAVNFVFINIEIINVPLLGTIIISVSRRLTSTNPTLQSGREICVNIRSVSNKLRFDCQRNNEGMFPIGRYIILSFSNAQHTILCELQTIAFRAFGKFMIGDYIIYEHEYIYSCIIIL